MTPKKAIIIVLIMFLVMVIVFAFLYINKPVNQSANQPADKNTSAGSSNQDKLSPLQRKIKDIEVKTNAQVEKIVEQGRTATGGITKEAAAKLDETINQAITEEKKLKTPEQLKADEQRRLEQEKLDQQINQQIKDQLKNK